MLITRRLISRLILGGVGTLPLVRLARAAVAHRLTVLHMNDFHSRHLPVDGRSMTCTGSEGCFGGSARLAAAVREQREAAAAEGRTVVLLDGGDQFQGSLFYTAHHGMAELAVQHALGTDAMAVGNHEFDNGPENLGRYVAAARFPVLAANIDVGAEPALSGLRRFAVIERGGLRIGLVGLTTEETRTSSSPGPLVRFMAPGAALAAAAAAARAAGAQIVIVLSHLGLPLDRMLEGVPLIIGGHTHTLLSNDEAGAQGPHPVVSARGPLIVQAGAYGRYLGRVDLDLGEDGGIVAYGGACRHVGLDLVPDPAVAAIVAAYAAPLEALRTRAVATLGAPLEVTTCRVAPCALGGLVANALRGAAHPGESGMPVVGLMNAGGLRVGLPAGAVTLGQVLDTMPFGNTLATVVLTGADLLGVVEHGRGMTGRGGYPQWAGLRLTPSVQVQGADGVWGAIEPGAKYLVATNNFLRTGGDGYVVLRDRGMESYDAGPAIADLFAEALARLRVQ